MRLKVIFSIKHLLLFVYRGSTILFLCVFSRSKTLQCGLHTPENHLSNHWRSATPLEVFNTTKQLQDKKSCDMNGISSYLIKNVLNCIIEPVSHVFNLSVSSGVVPDQLKIAKISPIHKSGDTSDADNYRPISLLCTFSKILEKLIANRLVEYLDTNEIITKFQFGFRKSHNTAHPMVHLLNKISESLNQKKFSAVIFCDLKKAFDTCDHQILLKKLSKIGIKNLELKWFESYLSNRKQFVQIGDIKSCLLSIEKGVPQGSILGPMSPCTSLKRETGVLPK